jgi:DNA-binding MurR/RpiR family transcriptional regulator
MASKSPSQTPGRKLSVPTDFAALRKRVAQREGALSEEVNDMADYLIGHPHEVAFGAVRGVAIFLSVSSTTVFRLAQSLGFDSFTELREEFRAPLRNSPPQGPTMR